MKCPPKLKKSFIHKGVSCDAITKKTKGKRIEEVLEMRKKLSSLGITGTAKGFHALLHVMRQFVDTGENDSGKIRLKGTNRVAHYIFTSTKRKESSLLLKYSLEN